MDNCFPKTARLLKSEQYQRVYDAGKKKAGRCLQIFYCPNELNQCRFGISVSRRFGNSVRRNLVKRRIREGVRTSKSLLSGWDVIVHPKTGAGTATESEIASDLRGLLEFVGQRKEFGTGKAKSSEGSSSL